METSEILEQLPNRQSSGKVRRRVLVAGIAALAVVGPFLGVSFLANSGTVSTSVTGSTSSGSLVDTSCTGTSVPTLAYTTNCSAASAAFTTPSWSPSAGSAGSVTSGGDIGLINTTGQTSPVVVDVYVTDLQGLNEDYSSFALPINVYQCTTSTSGSPSCSGTSGGTPWTSITSWDSTNYSSVPYLTSSSGFFSITLQPGDWYDVAIDSGGMYYCISTSTTSPATLSPTFFVTASAT